MNYTALCMQCVASMKKTTKTTSLHGKDGC